MNKSQRLDISPGDVFGPLRAKHEEALNRMDRAEGAVAEAYRRLNADLAVGRDTSTARRVLHEAKRLLDEATQAALEAAQALSFATDRAIGEMADELTRSTNAAIAASLSQFNIKEHDRGNRP